MRRTALILGLVAACGILFPLSSSPAEAGLISLNANFLSTSFTPSGGAHSLGVLTISDAADIVREDTGGQTTYTGGNFLLTASLLTDTSSGGVASGDFQPGSLVLKDSLNQDLLTGTVDDMVLTEVAGAPDLLVGQGTFTVTGGSLQAAWGQSFGNLVQITFFVSPAGIADFSSSFGAQTNATLTPIPEPATMLLVGGGLMMLVRRVRARRAR